MRMTCSCGAMLNDHEIPNDTQLTVYTDKEWDKICDCDNIEPWMIPLPTYDVWRCPRCKSIYVYEYDKPSPIMVYRLEKRTKTTWRMILNRLRSRLYPRGHNAMDRGIFYDNANE